MKTFEEKKQEALAITDPRQAHIKIWTDKELSLLEMDEIAMRIRRSTEWEWKR